MPPTNTTSLNIGGTDAWAVPYLKFLGDHPPSPPLGLCPCKKHLTHLIPRWRNFKPMKLPLQRTIIIIIKLFTIFNVLLLSVNTFLFHKCYKILHSECDFCYKITALQPCLRFSDIRRAMVSFSSMSPMVMCCFFRGLLERCTE